MANSQSTYKSILDVVHTWSPQQRYRLIQDLLKTLEPYYQEGQSPTPPQDTLEIALGLLETNHPTPSDEEITAWLEEHRLDKYG